MRRPVVGNFDVPLRETGFGRFEIVPTELPYFTGRLRPPTASGLVRVFETGAGRKGPSLDWIAFATILLLGWACKLGPSEISTLRAPLTPLTTGALTAGTEGAEGAVLFLLAGGRRVVFLEPKPVKLGDTPLDTGKQPVVDTGGIVRAETRSTPVQAKVGPSEELVLLVEFDFEWPDNLARFTILRAGTAGGGTRGRSHFELGVDNKGGFKDFVGTTTGEGFSRSCWPCKFAVGKAFAKITQLRDTPTQKSLT